MMINEHISKDAFVQEICPIGKETCKYGFQACRYTINRFKVIRCCPGYITKVNAVHKKELQDRQALNIKSWDYKSQLNKSKEGI